MSKEIIILAATWILVIVVLILSIPKNKFREAQVIFFFKQLMTWILGLAVVEFGLIEYPVRMFSNATKANFCFEYFFYPSICVVFNLHYPEGKSHIRQSLHYFLFCTVMTIFEVLCEKYTDILEYVHWNWFYTWITLFITFFLSRQYYTWFFKLRGKHA